MNTIYIPPPFRAHLRAWWRDRGWQLAWMLFYSLLIWLSGFAPGLLAGRLGR